MRGRLGRKPAVLIDERDDGFREDHEADRGWNRQQHDEAQSMREGSAKFGFISKRGAARNQWKSDCGDGDAENAEG